jgi:hypothetical protein
MRGECQLVNEPWDYKARKESGIQSLGEYFDFTNHRSDARKPVLAFPNLPAPMARLRAEDVLKRYAAGERDFRGADLQGLRFRRACLAGADFSGADLRGTDFLEADLRGAKFVGARCGIPLERSLGHAVVAAGAGAAVGALQVFFIVPISYAILDKSVGLRGILGTTGSSVIF